MAYTSEIDKLEQRYRENPKGRNFAPLADAYRKAGLLDNAIELCKSGLERHPDYVSAYIVYGRCLLDQKNDAAAADVFRKVTGLDPENVLGLRMLAEIAERGGRFEEAVEWLTKLLGADPMNGDAAEALSRAKSRVAQAAARTAEPVVQKLEPPPAPPVPPPPARPASVAPAPAPLAKTAPVPKHQLVVEHVSERPVAPELTPAAPPAGEIETFDGTLDFNAAAHQMAKAEGLEVQEDIELKPQNVVVEGLARTQFESTLSGPSEPEPDMPQVDLPLIMPEEVGSAPAAPEDASPAVLAPPVPLAPPAPPPPPPAPAPVPAAVALADDDGAADAAALSRAEPVLTETMAELYLKQGHSEDALRVYQALLARRPHDARLRARVEALSSRGRLQPAVVGAGLVGESLPAFLKRILAGRPQPLEPPAGAGAGSPLASAFAVASLEQEPAPEIDAPGAATRPAHDTISLDQVFGDEAGIVPESLARIEPRSPSAPEPPPPAASEPTPPTGGFSFDQFFGAPTSPPAPAEAPAAPGASPGPRTSGPKARPAAEDEGDLDQFQAWLKGLKS